MKATIKPDGRHHSIPRCMYGFFSNLEFLAGVEEVRGGKFLRRRRFSKTLQTQIQHYDETSRILRVKVHYKQFTAFFNLRINPDYGKSVEDYIRNYGQNGNSNQ